MRPPLMATIVNMRGRLPRTRRAALVAWNRIIRTASLLATSAIALGAALQGVGNAWETTLLGLGLVFGLPVLWVAVARIAEKKYLSRPPKGYLAAALGFDFGGIALVALAVVLLQSETSSAEPLLKAGGFLEGCGTLLLGAWFAAVLAMEPRGDHMHAL